MKKLITLLLVIVALDTNAQFMLSGPDGPELSFQYNNGQLAITLMNQPTSNNAQEMYVEYDPPLTNAPDSTFDFQGYIIYQLVDTNATIADRYDPSKARVVFQCDISDTIDLL